jgi:DNA-binding CsgD family transcriptional regulator
MLTRRRAIPRVEVEEDEPSPDARATLEVFRDVATPVMASDARGRVVFWNPAAEKLLARSAAVALGRRCGQVVGARDVFGNRYCTDDCPLLGMARRNEPVRPFEWRVAGAPEGQTRRARVQVLRLPGSAPGDYVLVHLIEPLDEDAHLREVLSILSASAAPGAPAPVAPLAPPPLTRREQEVLAGIASGLQNKEIAVRLGISLATVRNHVHAILEKLQVHSKLEALSLAVREGWVRPTPEAKA